MGGSGTKDDTVGSITDVTSGDDNKGSITSGPGVTSGGDSTSGDGNAETSALTNIGYVRRGDVGDAVKRASATTAGDHPGHAGRPDRAERRSGPPSNPDDQRAYAMTLTSRSGDRYVLGPQIAKGGMGEILAATDAQIGREVAVKRMRQKSPSDRAMGRFFREACIQGRLDHPAIVPVYELGCDEDGRPFFAMKKLVGKTLQERIEDGQPWQRLLRAFVDTCLAVELAHTRGVVHRDLKPANIVLGDFGECYVLDWGVAKIIGDDRDEVATGEPGRGDRRSGDPIFVPGESGEPHEHTADGVALGTIGYMAPEQARGDRDIDARADVYALGCTLFEILSGEPLHRHKANAEASLASTLAPIDARPSQRAPGRDIPPELDVLCVEATVIDRAQRIKTARELGERVQRYLDGDRDLATRRDLALRELGTARAAFESRDDEDARKVAMRHAGRALALDPALHGAAELVSRLMLEPPRSTPPEVARAIAVSDLATLKEGARAGVFGYAGFAALLPLFATGGTRAIAYIGILVAILIINGVILLTYGFANLRIRSFTVALSHAVLIGLLAHMFSPFLVAPGVAAVVTMGLVFSPYYRGKGVAALVATMAVAIVTPYLLEASGVIARMTVIGRDGFTMFPAFDLHPGVWITCLVIYTIALVAAAGGIAYAMRTSERRVRHHLALQSWQLQQLVAR